MKLTGQYFELDVKKSEKMLTDYIYELIREGLRIALKDMEAFIPVWTGHAKATLLGLAKDLGIPWQINPEKEDSYEGDNKNYGFSATGIDHGVMNTVQPREMFRTNKSGFTFNSQIKAKHYLWWDVETNDHPNKYIFKPKKSEPPWGTFDIANSTLQEFIDRNWELTLPNFESAFTERRFD